MGNVMYIKRARRRYFPLRRRYGLLSKVMMFAEYESDFLAVGLGSDTVMVLNVYLFRRSNIIMRSM